MYRIYYFLQTDIICLIILFLILITIVKKSVVNNSLSVFKKTIISCMLFCLLDAIVYCLQSYNLFSIRYILIICNTIYLGLILVIGHFWNKYVNIRVLFKKPDTYKFISEYFCLIVGSILLVINLFNGCVFSITDNNQFVSGFCMFFYLLICWGSILISVIMLLENYFKANSIIEKKESLGMMPFIVAPFICNLTQLIIGNLSLTQAGLTISMLLIFLNYQQRIISLDNLTGIYNRNYLNEYVDNLYKRRKGTISVFVIDIDKFKSINDTFGHDKGDEVLIKVALVLNDACEKIDKKLKLARYGGDEFIIVGDVDDACGQKLVKEIDKNLEKIKLSQNKVSVSIGYVTGKKIQDTSFKDLLILADNNMYLVKRKK